jgi:hypothetical protein
MRRVGNLPGPIPQLAARRLGHLQQEVAVFGQREQTESLAIVRRQHLERRGQQLRGAWRNAAIQLLAAAQEQVRLEQAAGCAQRTNGGGNRSLAVAGRLGDVAPARPLPAVAARLGDSAPARPLPAVAARLGDVAPRIVAQSAGRALARPEPGGSPVRSLKGRPTRASTPQSK